MNKLITAITLSFSLVLLAQAQTGFIKSYGTAICYEEAISVVPTVNGYMVSAASNCAGGAQNWDAYLFEIDRNGDTIWSSSNLAANGMMIKTTDGNLVFAGGDIAGNAYNTIMISKTDVTGQIIWTHNFSFYSCKNTVSKIVEIADGYLVTGYYPSNSCQSPIYDAFVMKLDAQGNTVWAERIDGAGTDQLHDVVTMPNGNIAAFGWTNSETNNNGNDYLLAILDANGRLISRKQFGNEYNNFGYGIEVAYDGGLISTGYTNVMESYKLAADGTIEWRKEYGATCGSTYFDVAQTIDGGYAYLGTEDVAGQCAAMLMKTDSLGNVVWKKNWDARLRDFIELDNGSFVLAGYANYLPDAVVVLFDSTQLTVSVIDTTVTPDTTVQDSTETEIELNGSGVSTSVNEAELNNRTGNLKLYPNPAQNVLNISFYNKDNDNYSLSLYSVTGQLVYHQDAITGEQVRVDVTELVSGAYIYQLTGGGNIYAGQFMVQ